MSRLVLVLGDQLSLSLSALQAADKAKDTVVMAEVADETTYVRHHPKKIALVLAAMRKFARVLEAEGWTVLYTELDDTDNAGSIVGELLRQHMDMESRYEAARRRFMGRKPRRLSRGRYPSREELHERSRLR